MASRLRAAIWEALKESMVSRAAWVVCDYGIGWARRILRKCESGRRLILAGGMGRGWRNDGTHDEKAKSMATFGSGSLVVESGE